MKLEKIISIVTPSFNQAAFIEETIRSVITQQGNFYIDYIIMDGGSTDHTVSILQDYEKIIKQQPESVNQGTLAFYKGNPEIDLVQCKGLSFRWVSEKDKGQSDAINKGLRIAVGDILAFLNSDDTYYPGALQKIINFRWRNADFLYGEGMWISKDGKELMPYPTFEPNKYNFVYQCTLCQPAVFFRKETYERLGEFSTDFHVIFDFEYWMRAVFRGMKFRHIDDKLATSRFYLENKTLADQKTQVNEVPLLTKKYYTKPLNAFEKWKVKRAKHTVHKQTIERVNRLQELMNSDVRYVFK